MADCCNMQIDQLLAFIRTIHNDAVNPLVESLIKSLESLVAIGLGYLTLNRETSTLSGGESQRIKLVRHLGSSLTDLTYILDEPSVGLHPHDVQQLNNLLIELRDKGNTLLVIEHDPDVIAIADHIIDMGIGAGKEGGCIIYQGNYEGIKQANTPTAQYLNEIKQLKTTPRAPHGCLTIENSSLNNLKHITTQIPKEVLTVITGVAGSGKSSLVQAFITKYPDIVVVDQTPVKGSKRSNIATYTGILDRIRILFAQHNCVKQALFSRNSEGACLECRGAGTISNDLAFLDTVEVVCEHCKGTGYRPEVLKYKLYEKSIVEVMALTVHEALLYFKDTEILETLHRLYKVGLEYITLGQSLSSFSGGERQRLKLATKLEAKGKVYLFDEPTTGLHGSDISKLINLFNSLVDNKNTVIIIEHNMSVISQADWIIDMGLEAGNKGGNIIFEGIPQELTKDKVSLTGRYLKRYLHGPSLSPLATRSIG